jgi:PAS domain S-box-containing protein
MKANPRSTVAAPPLGCDADVESFMIEYYGAWQGMDEDRIMSYYAENVTVQIPGTLMQGQSAVREQFVRPFITGFPGNRHIVKSMVFGRNVVVVEFSFNAQHKGPFAGRAATDAHVEVQGTGVYEYDPATRQITAARIYFDVGTLLKQLLDPRYPHLATEEAAAAAGPIAAPVEHLDPITVLNLYRDLKASETELRRAHTHLTEAQRLSLTGSFTWDVQADDHIWSTEIYRIFGFEPGVKPTMPMIQAVIHPEDMPAVEAVLGGAAQGADFDLDFRIITPTGTVRHAHVVGHRDEQIADRPVFMGAVQDVTASKRAEAEIRALKDQLYRENLALRDEVDRASMFEEIIGSSQTLKTVLSRIASVAPSDSTVFISGETGTGKELIARAVHKRSQRSRRAFVSVNCGALAPTLIPSELFGHEKGAFTGATQRRLGRFELADGGTIFLDEVSELLPDTQAMLLRVLQEREFERVGGTQPIRVDVRIIAATNRDLKAAIAAGSFRQDLYYRLNVFPIEVPPLRDRKDDLLMLVEYFVQRYAGRAGKPIRSIDKKTLDLLQAYEWPGNIRELQNVIERSVILSTGGVFAVDELWLSTGSAQSTPGTPSSKPLQAEPRDEREIIEAALAESRGRIAGRSGAAARLNIPPSTLEYKIKSLKIRKSQFKFGGRPRDIR